jgi:hypothetical protein
MPFSQPSVGDSFGGDRAGDLGQWAQKYQVIDQVASVLLEQSRYLRSGGIRDLPSLILG